jgi:flagellar M-ring protein FliF
MEDQTLPVAAPASRLEPTILSGSTLAPLRNFADQPAFKRALPAVGLVGVAGVAIAAWLALQSPSQVPLFQGLNDTDKAAVAEALRASGTDYTIDAASGAIGVDEATVHEARMLLAAQGLPKSVPSGDAAIAALPMGSSRAVETETLRGARESDLARTIEAIDTIKSARVHIANTEPSAFVRDQAGPQASVMLVLHGGRSLSDAQVRAVRHLVASSVPGMTADKVSVIDQSGALLSQQDAAAEDPALQMQTGIEDRYRKALVTLIGPIVGRDNFTAEVHADIDLTESQATRETYPKEDRALKREEGNRSGNLVAPAIGIPGALSNQPPPPAILTETPQDARASNAPGSQTNETYARSFDVGREISVTHKPQGRVARLSVAVALRELPGAKKRTATEIAAIEILVKGAVGFDAARGDVVAISSRPFASTDTPELPFWDSTWFMPLVRQVGALLALLMVLLFVGRPLLKAMRVRAAAGAQSPATAERQHRPIVPDVTLDMIERAPGYAARADLVRGFVQQNPERSALVVRTMISEPTNG